MKVRMESGDSGGGDDGEGKAFLTAELGCEGPHGIRGSSMPYTAWKHMPETCSSAENVLAEVVERVLLLAIVWERKGQVARFVRTILKVYGEWSLDGATIGLAWSDDQMLVVLTSIGQLNLFAEDGTVIHQTRHSGKLSPAIGDLKHLTGLYLHYNSLYGGIPREIANLTELSDLYLNVNHLSSEIPSEFGKMESLQVLLLFYNQLTGRIPTQLGDLKKLSVLSLQSNKLAGAIPASLGDLGMLMRLDLSSNNLFGSIPTRLANAPFLQVLDVHNNNLSGNVPPALKRLDDKFVYEYNLGLCGDGFSSLEACNASDYSNQNRPEPYGAGVGVTPKEIPETASCLAIQLGAKTRRNPKRQCLLPSTEAKAW
ncbi:hypothetical protein KIW84_013074 [Lathyrus oleraceus]|uniref:Uncharacterized protein n=1 Tax=Pisum sativum TaxID=3888 RepID=A0A9D5BJK6_PEA|nr:hypothetical protein KIW84_013074 [Pisum sativum]